MAQKTLFEWAQPAEPGLALASEARRDAKRAERAQELGLVWPPPPKKRGVGRPTDQALYEERLYAELRKDNFAALSHLTDAVMPPWYKHRGPLRMPLPDIGAAHHAMPAAGSADVLAAWAEEAPAAAAAPAPAPAAEEGAESAEPPSKKAKTDRKGARFLRPSASTGVVPFLVCPHEKLLATTLNANAGPSLCKLCPEIFEQVDINTFRRWHPVEGGSSSNNSAGRKQKLSPGTVQELEVVVLSLVRRGVPLNIPLVKALINEQIAPLTVGRSWTWEFLRGLGLSCQSLSVVSQKMKYTHTLQIGDLQRITALKLLWLQRHHGIPAWRCYNLDETWVKLLPAPGRSWGFKAGSAEARDSAPQSDFPKGRSLAATVTLAIPVYAPDAPQQLQPVAQVITQGTTDKSTPPRPWPVRVECRATESHWASQDTVFQLLLQIQAEVGPGVAWICLWDMAPIHCARPLLDKIEAELPTCKLCFLLPGTTAFCQPCDMVMFRPFKANMSQVWCTAAAKEVLHERDALGRITKPLALRADLPWLVKGAMESVCTQQRSEKGWRHLRFSEEEVPKALSQADELHSRGCLFSAVVPDAEEDQQQQQTAAETQAANEEAEDEEETGLGDAEPEIPAAPAAATAADTSQKVPTDSAMQIGKFLALRLVYGNPERATLDAIAEAAVPKPKAKAKAKAKGLPASSSTSRWATNKLFQSQGLPSICPCSGRPLIYQTYSGGVLALRFG